MKRIILTTAIFVALAAGLCSCQFFECEETVAFEFPEWPDYLPELLGWKLEKNGVPELVEGRSAHATSITLRLDKNKPCSITATPVTQNQFFKPAGTIYPYSQKITWSGGYASRLYNTIGGHEQFNWEKLLEKLESCDNPWLLDSQEILEAIDYHSFNANKLKLSGTISVSLDFTVFSSYVPQNQALEQQNSQVIVKKGQPELFALCQGTEFPQYAIIICASSSKNISLDLVSMPIFKEEL